LVEAVQVVLQGGLHSVRAQTIWPPVHFVLLEAKRRAYLQNLPAILATDDARIVFRVVRPSLQNSAQVSRVIHIATPIMNYLA
jgi:hypothetical protein